MKKVVLKNLNLNKFSDFIGMLIPLNEAATTYFTIDEDRIYTDSHNDSGTIIKSVSLPITDICESHNVTEKVKLCFYDGKKVLKAFGFLNGNTVNCQIDYTEVDGENYAQKMTNQSSKMKVSLDAADPSLIEFANVPEESMEEVKDVANAECTFKLSSNELLQIQKMCDFDTGNDLSFTINGSVKIGSKDIFELDIDENFAGTDTLVECKLDKDLFKLIDSDAYDVYTLVEEGKVIFKSETNTNSVIVSLHEEM
jgi:hypothetical protein